MTKRIPQTRADLERHLGEQLSFLERSAEAFDKGYRQEAKRLAATIRNLLHDTSVSHSLLRQLGLKDRKFIDSALPSESGDLATYSGLVAIKLGDGAAEHVPLLNADGPDFGKPINFDIWWNATILRDDAGVEFSRKALVLEVANTDGGAHVDPSLNEAYSRLSRNNSLRRWSANNIGNTPLGDAELASVRQIAHEVLKTLDPQYSYKLQSKGGAFVSGVSFIIDAPNPSDNSP